MNIEEIIYTGATTEDEQLAIQTCPHYEATLERASRNSYDEVRVINSRTYCLKEDWCKVSLTWKPLIRRLSISGKCLME